MPAEGNEEIAPTTTWVTVCASPLFVVPGMTTGGKSAYEIDASAPASYIMMALLLLLVQSVQYVRIRYVLHGVRLTS